MRSASPISTAWVCVSLFAASIVGGACTHGEQRDKDATNMEPRAALPEGVTLVNLTGISVDSACLTQCISRFRELIDAQRLDPLRVEITDITDPLVTDISNAAHLELDHAGQRFIIPLNDERPRIIASSDKGIAAFAVRSEDNFSLRPCVKTK